MLAVNAKQLNDAIEIDLSRCEAKLDRRLAELSRERRLLSRAAMRASDDSPWMALKVLTGRELAVEKVLLAAGVEVCVPMRMGPELRRRGRVSPPQALPVLLGYVLVRCVVSSEAIAGLIGIEKVLGIVGGNETPWLMSVENIRAFADKAADGRYDWERPAGLFRRGMQIEIKDGLFAGAKGTILSCRSDGKGDAAIELMFFNGVTAALIPLANLNPL